MNSSTPVGDLVTVLLQAAESLPVYPDGMTPPAANATTGGVKPHEVLALLAGLALFGLVAAMMFADSLRRLGLLLGGAACALGLVCLNAGAPQVGIAAALAGGLLLVGLLLLGQNLPSFSSDDRARGGGTAWVWTAAALLAMASISGFASLAISPAPDARAKVWMQTESAAPIVPEPLSDLNDPASGPELKVRRNRRESPLVTNAPREVPEGAPLAYNMAIDQILPDEPSDEPAIDDITYRPQSDHPPRDMTHALNFPQVLGAVFGVVLLGLAMLVSTPQMRQIGPLGRWAGKAKTS